MAIPSSIAVEAWDHGGGLGVWFVVREGERIEAVSSAIVLATTQKQRDRLRLPLDELVRQVKEAAERRDTLTSGRIGVDPSLPMLVTDANDLQDHYKALGAVYEGDRRTVLPPPAPFQETPPQEPGDIVDTTTAPTSATSAPTSTSAPTTSSTVPASTTSTTSTTVPASSTTVPASSTTSSTQPVSGAPGVPREVAVSESWVVSWQAPASGGRVVTYDVEAVFTRRDGDPVTETASVSGLSYDASGWVTANGPAFTVRVRAQNPAGTSSWTQPVSPE